PLPTSRVFRTAFDAGSTTEIVPPSRFGTHRASFTHAEPTGFAPTTMVAVTTPRAGSIRLTRFVSAETQSESAEGVIQSARGTAIRSVTRFVRGSTRTTAPRPGSATQIEPNAYATPFGCPPTLIFAATRFVLALIR